MSIKPIEKVVIVGGGTAGWIAASALAKAYGEQVRIELIESDAVGTVGVGEATIPQIRRLNAYLGLDENEFVRETSGTFKLGIEFVNWGQVGERYLHTFGSIGVNLSHTHFHQYWLRARQAGHNSSLWDYSLHQQAANECKFDRLDRVGNTSMTGLAYAFHFDAGRYALYLRRFAEGLGVVRTEGKITDVQLRAEDGFIQSVALENGDRIEGDLFVDCSGFRGLLIGDALSVPYHDWSHWLPCNRAVAVPCESAEKLLPYTRSTAHSAGWQWRIPLQHRIGNGHVFSSAFMDEEEATDILLQNLDGAPQADPRVLKFTTGRRDRFWEKNCVSLGLSSGFMEPLESTSIHLIQSNVDKLIHLFPDQQFAQPDIDEYNRQVGREFDLIRDFLILHYHQTQRTDSEFWNYCRTMSIPDSLAAKIELFHANGRLFPEGDDLFRDASWVQVMLGQNLMPQGYHPSANRLSDAQLTEFLSNVRTIVNKAVAPLPTHAAFIERHCAATT